MNNKLTPHIEYYSNGNVCIKGQKNPSGQREGIWEWFYENGNILCRTPFKDGKWDGIEILWNKDGEIKEINHYRKGKLTETYLWEDGKLIETTKH